MAEAWSVDPIPDCFGCQHFGSLGREAELQLVTVRS